MGWLRGRTRGLICRSVVQIAGVTCSMIWGKSQELEKTPLLGVLIDVLWWLLYMILHVLRVQHVQVAVPTL